MATYTSNYGWTKPSGSDNVDISVLNNNLDDQDSTIHDAFLNMAPPFSESSTYAVDDIVLHGTGLYKCRTAVVTPGSWTGSTNWQVYKLSEGGSGGGGTSNYNQLTNKPQINNVELSGNKTAAQLGLMASDGVVANPTGQTTGTLTALEVGGTKYAVGGGSSLTAGDYIEIDENDKINVKLQKGDYTEYEYRLTGAYSPVNQLTIEKYRDGVLVSTESYRNDASYTPIAIDGLFEIWYTASSPRYYWHYKLLEDSQEHSVGYEDSWYYTDTTTRTETFDVDDESAELVTKGDLSAVATSGSYTDLTNKPSINDQTPTFTQASTRNNIASGENLSVILGKVQKFFNDLKTVAFSGNASDLNYDNADSGLSATKVQGAIDELAESYPADKVMMSDGVTSVEDMFFAPDYAHAVAVTPNTTYSVLNDGYFIAARLYGSTAGAWISINGLSVMQCNPGSARDMGSCVYPVKKGDTVITTNLDASTAKLFFAPYRR